MPDRCAARSSEAKGHTHDATTSRHPCVIDAAPAKTSYAPRVGHVPELSRVRLRAGLPFVVLGLACVIAGGLVAAVTAHAPTQPASWAAAYLVLVGGVAALGFGAGQAVLASTVPTPRQVGLQLGAWYVGNAAVLVGTLVENTRLVDLGGLLLVAGLVLLVHGVRGSGRRRAGRESTNGEHGGHSGEGAPSAPSWALLAYRGLVLLLLVSIPVGLVLANA